MARGAGIMERFKLEKIMGNACPEKEHFCKANKLLIQICKCITCLVLPHLTQINNNLK